MSGPANYRPSAGLVTLQIRARIRKQIRAFFDPRGVLEVETPVLAQAGVTDPHIDSMKSCWSKHAGDIYLQTSPEYAMKRLLAAGSGSIYQMSKVFRYGERGRHHHPEFTMLEWYRVGFDHHQLMLEVDSLVRKLLLDHLTLNPSCFWTYREVWKQTIDLDPLKSTLAQLQAFVEEQGIDISGLEDDIAGWQQLIMTHCVEPRLPQDTPVFIYDFPACQAALAKIRDEDLPVAERFELYINGMELANGFHELTDADEQRKRFQAELLKRKAMGKPEMPVDEHLLAALPFVPDCAGVALGLDRLIMLVIGAQRIDEVLSFVVDEPR
ncbi:MAG: EF-P lysine aminoacylase EpmA [Gammaproteobacteria bacterium]|nr:EF-P lysine aminoacylase EpmA [Gammaproteobacteria bacterium]MDH5651071.1 EF-P lysine aminoacylase EpmA [Gammaproteobacteria bacterium]